MAEPDTEELLAEQVQKARREHARAESSEDVTEEHQHVRRADKADYLKEKLHARARSEERVERGA
jgi:hypothetical protein